MDQDTLIGCVTYSKKRYCQARFIQSLRSLQGGAATLVVDNSEGDDYARSWSGMGFETLRSRPLPTRQLRLAEAYRTLRREFLRRGHRRLLILEQDVLPPPDALERLLERDEAVVGGLYFIGRGKKRIPCVIRGNPRRLDENPLPPFVLPDGRVAVEASQARLAVRRLPGSTVVFRYDAVPEKALPDQGLLQVYALGLGCVLIGREALERIDFRPQLDLNGEVHGHCDMAFHDDCRRWGIPVFLEASVRCRHLVGRVALSADATDQTDR